MFVPPIQPMLVLLFTWSLKHELKAFSYLHQVMGSLSPLAITCETAILLGTTLPA